MTARPSPGPGAAVKAPSGKRGTRTNAVSVPSSRSRPSSARQRIAGWPVSAVVQAPSKRHSSPVPSPAQSAFSPVRSSAVTGSPGPPFDAFHGPGAVGSSPGPADAVRTPASTASHESCAGWIRSVLPGGTVSV